MPYVPPHLRNKPADGADGAAAPPPSGGGKSLADLAASAPAGGDRRGGRDRRGGGDRRDRGERTSGERGERNSGERRDNGGGRDGGRRGGGGGRSRASAPKAFGTIAGRKTMEPHEDIENGERVDGEGMVYRMVDADESGGPAATYFCDRFRRYRFHCGEAGLMLLAALVRKLEACLELNEERFDPDAARAEEQRKQGYVLYEEKPTLRKSGAPRNSAQFGAIRRNSAQFSAIFRDCLTRDRSSSQASSARGPTRSTASRGSSGCTCGTSRSR
jgi:hypothetical protein